MQKGLWRNWLCSLVGWAGMTGCGGAHMAVPADFAKGMDKLTTDGRPGPDEAEPFELGPYRIDSVERKLTNTDGFDAIAEFKPTTEGGYHYSMSGPKGKLNGKCAPRASERIEDIDGSVTVKKEIALGCICESKGKPVAHVLVEDLAGEYGGPLSVGEVQARAMGVYKLENGDKVSDRPAGYRVDDDANAVAALDVISGEARLWLKDDLKERERGRLVCTLVGLMLWNPPAKKQN